MYSGLRAISLTQVNGRRRLTANGGWAGGRTEGGLGNGLGGGTGLTPSGRGLATVALPDATAVVAAAAAVVVGA